MSITEPLKSHSLHLGCEGCKKFPSEATLFRSMGRDKEDRACYRVELTMAIRIYSSTATTGYTANAVTSKPSVTKNMHVRCVRNGQSGEDAVMENDLQGRGK